MKNKLSSWLLAACAVLAFAFLLAPVAHAADAVTTAATTVAAAPAWYQSLFSAENIAWALGLVATLAAIVQNKTLTTTQKSLRAVVAGVESASQLPSVQAEAAKIKASIANFAASHGVSAELDEVVQAIASQFKDVPQQDTLAAVLDSTVERSAPAAAAPAAQA